MQDSQEESVHCPAGVPPLSAILLPLILLLVRPDCKKITARFQAALQHSSEHTKPTRAQSLHEVSFCGFPVEFLDLQVSSGVIILSHYTFGYSVGVHRTDGCTANSFGVLVSSHFE